MGCVLTSTAICIEYTVDPVDDTAERKVALMTDNFYINVWTVTTSCLLSVCTYIGVALWMNYHTTYGLSFPGTVEFTHLSGLTRIHTRTQNTVFYPVKIWEKLHNISSVVQSRGSHISWFLIIFPTGDPLTTEQGLNPKRFAPCTLFSLKMLPIDRYIVFYIGSKLLSTKCSLESPEPPK